MKVKICGITNRRDYIDAVNLGANYVGFIFFRGSPRYVSPDDIIKICSVSLSKEHRKVGVFVDEDINAIRDVYREARLDIVQLHGGESPQYVNKLGLPCWKAIRAADKKSLQAIIDYPCETFLLDSYTKNMYGGTGINISLELVEEALKIAMPLGKQIIAAGGISPDNIHTFMEMNPPPFAVDVNSSLEVSPGRKDRKRIEELFNKIKENNHEFTT